MSETIYLSNSNKDSDEERRVDLEKVEGSSSINNQQLLLGKANNNSCNSSKTNQKVIKIIN